MDGRVHYEVYVRRTPGAAWVLEMASERRGIALECAEELFRQGVVAAAKVTKETLDEETREFNTVIILKLGLVEVGKQKKEERPNAEPLCSSPADLYTLHSRERIARLLEAWLERHHATAFELLHRADLVEKLEAAGTEMQHAIQKIAVPESQARGVGVHEMMRKFQSLVDRATDRVIQDGRRKLFPNPEKENLVQALEKISTEGDRGYLLGGYIALAVKDAQSWPEKIDMLLDIADLAPPEGPERALVISTLQHPIAEILESKPGLGEMIGGKNLELGDKLAAMTRLAAHEAVELLIRVEPSVAKVMPELPPESLRLAKWMGQPEFLEVRTAMGKRIMRELSGPRRLKPSDAVAEIDLLRGLAMSLTAAAGKLLPLEDVQSAFSIRSKMLITGDFVEAYLGRDKSSTEELEALIWLTENVIGNSNKREAARWLKAIVQSLKFEKEVLNLDGDGETPSARLQKLAKLQKSCGRCGLAPEDAAPIQTKLGDLGGVIEEKGNIALTLSRANAPAIQRLTLLLKLACGETAPIGPAALRAKSEALKLAKNDEVRAELAEAPEQVSAVRQLIRQAGLAAA